MFRRLSRRFSGKQDTNGEVNGSSSPDGVSNPNGVNKYSANASNTRQQSFPTVNGTIDEQDDKSHEPKGVAETFEAFAQIIHASQRPLPTQTGDGSYVQHHEHTGLWADLRSMGIKDAKTLKEVIANKASGQLVDDKTMIMERVIQVRMGTHIPSFDVELTVSSWSPRCQLPRRHVVISPTPSSMSYGTTCNIRPFLIWAINSLIAKQTARTTTYSFHILVLPIHHMLAACSQRSSSLARCQIQV